MLVYFLFESFSLSWTEKLFVSKSEKCELCDSTSLILFPREKSLQLRAHGGSFLVCTRQQKWHRASLLYVPETTTLALSLSSWYELECVFFQLFISCLVVPKRSPKVTDCMLLLACLPISNHDLKCWLLKYMLGSFGQLSYRFRMCLQHFFKL